MTDELIIILMIVVFSVIGCVVVAETVKDATNQNDIQINITEKIPYHDGQYLIIAQHDGTEEVFSVNDVLVLGIFDASDRYARLKEGHTYTVTAAGYRFQLASWYRNINVIKGE